MIILLILRLLVLSSLLDDSLLEALSLSTIVWKHQLRKATCQPNMTYLNFKGIYWHGNQCFYGKAFDNNQQQRYHYNVITFFTDFLQKVESKWCSLILALDIEKDTPPEIKTIFLTGLRSLIFFNYLKKNSSILASREWHVACTNQIF